MPIKKRLAWLLIVVLTGCAQIPAPAPFASKPAGPSEPGCPRRGEAIVNFLVRDDGGIDDIKIEKTSGAPCVDEWAIKQVKGWRFTPGTHDGKPVAMRKTMRVILGEKDNSEQ